MKSAILAPHIDDELIGCYSVIMKWAGEGELHVFYFHDLVEERVTEAKAFAQYAGFTSWFAPEESSVRAIVKGFDQVFVPHRRDAHAHHKAVNTTYRDLATHFYSVDMVDAAPLPWQHQRAKKQLLDKFYSSQAALWERDHKYFLFESIHKSADFECYETVTVGMVEVTVLHQYARKVETFINELTVSNSKINSRDGFNKILQIATSGEVTMVVGEYTFKARQ